jgi:hypothetical protein
MKSLTNPIHRTSQGYCRVRFLAVVAGTALLFIGSQPDAFGWVAARGGYGGRGFVAAGRGYGYGAVAVRGGYYGGVARLPAGYYGAIPGAYRAVYYGGYNCYYAGGAYYRPAFYQGNTVYIVVR